MQARRSLSNRLGARKGVPLNRKKSASASRLERDILKKTFERLIAKGVSKDEINLLIRMRQNASLLSRQNAALQRKGKVNPVLSANAAKAWEAFYQQLSRY